MSSPLYSDTCRVLLLGALLVLSACASDAVQKSAPRPAMQRTPANAAEESAMLQSVPTAALSIFEQAVSAMAAGDLIEAELKLQEFLLQYPHYAGAHVNLAIIFAERGDLKAAENSLTDALILNPANAPALNQLGMLLRRKGEFEAAENAYLKAVDAQPDYALAHYNLGVLNDLYLQRLSTALQHYERYQALAGEDELVTKWIADLKRRISATQSAANVTE